MSEKKITIRNKTRDLNIRPYEMDGSGFTDYIKNVFTANDRYTNSSKNMLKKYGAYNITALTIEKTPILGIIDKAINLISLGKWETVKKEYNYDDLYHLYIIVTLDLGNGNSKKLVLEKNQSINISESLPSKTSKTQNVNIFIPKNITLNSLLENTLNRVGKDQYFIYDPFGGKNCQNWVKDVCQSNNLYNDRIDKFVFQPIAELSKDLGSITTGFSKFVTDTAAFGERLLGLGKQDKRYLKLVRLIAASYGYNPKDIKLANDGTHKLSLKHNGQNIKFGKQGMNDYIKYFLSGNEKMAVKKRDAYLKRSENIKGDWANDMYSKNSLARNILWMAQKKMGNGFNEVQMKLNNIGSGNDLKEVEGNSISDFELKKYLPDAKIIMYPDLKNYRTIEEILPSDKSYAIILYLQEKNNGHWVSIKRNKNKIEFFCSYGSKVDEPLSWISKKKNKELGQKPYLTNLLNSTKMNVSYNDIPYQKTNNDIVSCGRHVVFNIINFLDSGMNLKQYYILMKRLKKLHKMDYDEIVSKYVNIILD
jgi:hypothetical protein